MYYSESARLNHTIRQVSDYVRQNSIMLSDSQINAVPYMTASRTFNEAAE